MTKFYSVETCKQLEQLGCVSISKMWWCKYHCCHDDESFWNLKISKVFPKDPAEAIPAYSNADFTASLEAKENCIKLWGKFDIQEGIYCTHCDVGQTTLTPTWRVRANNLLDIILSGGDGESFIKEALKLD